VSMREVHHGGYEKGAPWWVGYTTGGG